MDIRIQFFHLFIFFIFYPSYALLSVQENEGNGCNSSQFQCLNDKCIAWKHVCDGSADCRDGSDERHCYKGCMRGLEFRCADGLPCMSSLLLCDGINDCEDGSDERNDTCPQPFEHHRCDSINQFKCVGSDECIRLAFRCDGQEDCADGSDEENCENYTCKPNEFFCKDTGRCIPIKFRCDGNRDCIDGSDEMNCGQFRIMNSDRCLSPNFLCKNDSKNTCLPPKFVCNFVMDCPFGDDEGFLCDKQMCSTANCEHLCHERPNGYGFACSCREGYILADDGKSCLKQQQNPCTFGACGQLCRFQTNHKFCHCEPGFELMEDNFTCRSIDPDQPKLIYTNRHEIRLLQLDSKEISFSVHSDLRNSFSIDYFYGNSNDIWLFWTDTDKIYKGKLQGQLLLNIEPLVSYGIWKVEGIAVDWLAKNVYWVDSSLNQIELTNFDGTIRTIILRGDMKNPRAISLDPNEGLMFWTDWNETNPRIERATMAGNDRRVLYRIANVIDGGWPNGLICDFIATRLYWIDAKSDSIHTIKYDGSDHREILRDGAYLAHPYALSTFENRVYWSDWRINAVVRANKWNGSSIQIVERTKYQPFDLKVIHRSRQPRGLRNPCSKNNGGCSHICTIDSPRSRVCVCPQMMQLDPQSGYQKCFPFYQTLLIATSIAIQSINRFHSDVLFPVITGKNIQNIGYMAINNKDAVVFWSDISRKTISKAFLKRTGEEKVVQRGISVSMGKIVISSILDLENCEGLAVDTEAGILYFSSWSSEDDSAQISVMDFDGIYRRTIISSIISPQLKKPKELVLDTRLGQMYWLDTGYEPYALFTATMAGEEINRIVFDDDYNCTVGAHSTSFDEESGELFWLQTDLPNIRGFNVRNKEKSQIIDVPSPNEDFASSDQIAVDSIHKTILYYNTKTNTVFASKLADFKHGKFAIVNQISEQTIESFVVGMAIFKREFETTDLKDGINACKGKAHLCLRSSPSSVRPFCTAGYNYKESSEKIAKCERIRTTLVYSVEGIGLKALSTRSESAEDNLNLLSLPPEMSFKPTFLTIDPRREKVYAVDSSKNEIWAWNYDSTDFTLIYNGGRADIVSIAVDEATGHLYVASKSPNEKLHGIIEMIDPNNSDNVMVIIKERDSVPIALRIDATEGYLFWLLPYIGVRRSRLDGSSPRTIVNRGFNFMAFSIRLDENQICFIDLTRKLECCDYHGKNLKKYATFKNPISSFVIDKSTLYYAYSEAGDWFIAERLLDENHEGPCSDNNGGCEEVCFNLGKNEITCFCPFGRLASDGKHCEGHSFLAFSQRHSIDFIAMDGTKPVEKAAFKPIRNTTIVRNVVDLVADEERYQLLFKVGTIGGIAFDFANRDLYFNSLGEHAIMRVSLRDAEPFSYPKKSTAIIYSSQSDILQGIAVDPCSMTIYFANSRSDAPTIERVYFSGYGRKPIITSNIRTPTAVAIDFNERKLYWSDAGLNKIERCDMDGEKREIILQDDVSPLGFSAHPFRLTIFDNTVFFTDWVHAAVIAIDKLTGGNEKIIKNELTEHPMGIVVVDGIVEQCIAHACKNMGCEDECRLNTVKEPFCSCKGNRRLNPDNRTCTDERIFRLCASEEWACLISQRCIRYENTCDSVKDCEMAEDEDPRFCASRSCRNGYFPCGNGLCIPVRNRCDGVNNCRNFQDEIGCNCSKDEFKCRNGLCIPKSVVCDQKMDCSDASDEMDCPLRNCSAEIVLKQSLVNCKYTTQCIHHNWLCDGVNDCWDGWDEQQCPLATAPPKIHRKAVKCADGYRRCNSTDICIPVGWVCDGNRDCADGSDEINCETTCNGELEYTCKSTGKCLDKMWRCDGKDDCADGSDEIDCEKECDEKDHFLCTNSKCIPKKWRCDGISDCLDHTANKSKDSLVGLSCEQGEFKCASPTGDSVQCVPRRYYCDGEADCEDGSDEPYFCDQRPCLSWQFRCGNGHCIAKNWTCNGIRDCADGADESLELCGNLISGFCASKMFQCENHLCIDNALVCDGKNDCGDNSDESKLCNINECLNDPCEDRCIDLPISFKCDCEPPRVLSKYDNRSCLLKNQCDDSPCSQKCINKGDLQYICICEPGYELSSDGRTCKHSDSVEPELLIISRHYIHSFSLTGNPKGALLSNLSNGVAVDYDSLTQLAYWTDVTQTRSNIGYTSINRSTHYKVFSGLSSNSPEGLAVDWLARNIYWCDKDGSSISVADLRGLYRYTIFKGEPLREPRAIVLDPMERLLFWTDLVGPYIGRMNMDGTTMRLIITTSLRWPHALAVDPTMNRIFWADGHLDYIGSSDYNGEYRKVVLSKSIGHVFGLTIFDDFLYWSDWSNRSIEKAHKISGQMHSTVVNFAYNRPMGIKIVHPVLQMNINAQNLSHPCTKDGICDNLCLLSDNREGFVCVCAQGFRAVGGKCIPDCKKIIPVYPNVMNMNNAMILNVTNNAIIRTDFVCRNTYKCIPFWWKCDGQDDCGDMEDEFFGLKGACPEFNCEGGQMQCESVNNQSTCIDSSQICNGVQECPLGDDENSHLCASYECIGGQFKCRNPPKCIPVSAVCDGKVDCMDGTDEQNCAPNNKTLTCNDSQFACISWTNGFVERCIPRVWFCDGHRDCPSGGDESPSCLNRDPSRPCLNEQFKCLSGRCIPVSWRCDGQHDCDRGEDEKDCFKSCHSNQFACAKNSRCIDKSWICDGDNDCGDGSDETSCEGGDKSISFGCDAPNFRCDDGSGCLELTQKCDGKRDCVDFSDEFGCNKCSNDSFACGHISSVCIRYDQFCDGKIDCDDGADEIYCSCQSISNGEENTFRCFDKNVTKSVNFLPYCIERREICDGISQCPNGHDEDPRVCAIHSCGENYLKCRNNKCYPQAALCDGIADCEDESDETNFYCNKTCRNLFRCATTNRCLPYSKQCDGRNDCGDGSDELECGVIPSICDHFGQCSQRCVRKNSFISCECSLGYVREFGRWGQCKAKGWKEAKIIILDSQMLHMASHFHNLSNVQLKTEESESYLSDFDYYFENNDGNILSRKIVYVWADAETNTIKKGALEEMYKKMPENRSKEIPTSRRSIRRCVLAIDWLNKNIYQTSVLSELKINGVVITVTALSQLNNANHTIPIIWGSLSRVSSIAVLPSIGKIYWSVLEPFAAIEIANLDGSERRALVLDAIYSPDSIAIDEPNSRFYWTDVAKGTIETMTIEGKDRRVIEKYGYKNGKLLDKPFGLDVFEDFLYFTGLPGGTVWRLNKFGSLAETEIHGLMISSRIVRLRVVHAAKKYPFDSPCRSDLSLGISHCGAQPCIPRIGDIANYICLCPYNEIYDHGVGKCLKLSAAVVSVPCGQQYCLNGGSCDGKICKCPEGFVGNRCETDLCHNYCLNKGNCSITYDPISSSRAVPTCSCPIEYTGSRCQQYKCTGRCGAYGTCLVSQKTGLPICNCLPNYGGAECNRRIDACETYCFNGGLCSYDENMAPSCQCPAGFIGNRCENCMLAKGEIRICQNGGYCKDGNQCSCPAGFSGSSCETDFCDGHCFNEGICLPSALNGVTHQLQCICPPGFGGSRCEIDWCHRNEHYCLHNGHCIHDRLKGIICICSSKFQGDRCKEERRCEDYCLNESECFSKSAYEWGCRCKAGYSGNRCDVFDKCSNQCHNGGTCQFDNRLGGVCECPKGIAGRSCTQIIARTCSEIVCLNGGKCMMTVLHGVQCSCPIGWGGLVCAEPECYGYCQNGGTCAVIEKRVVCSCFENWFGDRCQFLQRNKGTTDETRKGNYKQLPSQEIALVIFPILLIAFVAIVVVFLAFVSRTSYSFLHSHMEGAVTADGFQNPAYMINDQGVDNFAVNGFTDFTNSIGPLVQPDNATPLQNIENDVELLDRSPSQK